MTHVRPSHEDRFVTPKRGLSYVIVAGAGIALLATGGALPTIGGIVVGAAIGAAVDVVEFHWWDYDPARKRRLLQGVLALVVAFLFANLLLWSLQFASAADVSSGFLGLPVGHAVTHRTL